jgi:hypothetical protein
MFFDGTCQLLNTTVTSITQPLVSAMANQPSCPTIMDPNQVCCVTATNYRDTAEAFAELLVGKINYDDLGRISVFGSSIMTPLFCIIANIDPNNYTWAFNLAVPDLSFALEGMLGNVTLALISARTDTANVDMNFFWK